jgi:hypothetical protein
MRKNLALLICLTASRLYAATTWQPTDELLHAIRFVESSHGQFTVGDHGQSLGDYQLSEAAWLDVSSWRKSRGVRTYKYERHVWDRAVSRAYASDYLAILHGQLKKHLNRAPTAGEIYAAYNMGLSSFAQCRFELARVNPVTARKCEQIEAITGPVY